MDCNTAKAAIFHYVDREMDDADRARMESHLETCDDCRRLVQLEEAFRAALISPLRPDPTPPEVRERVVQTLAGLADRRERAAVRPRRRVVARLTAALLLLALGAGLGAWAQRWWNTEGRLADLAEAAVDQHQRLTRGLLPADIRGVSPKGAEEWFRKRLDFNVSLPELPNPQLTFRGGRVSHLSGVEVAALEYQVDGSDVSLFVMPSEAYRRLRLKDEPRFKLVTHRGYDVIIWRSATQDVGYTLVSEIGGRSCLVCHSNEERLEPLMKPRAHL
jgi:anti-sigma factor (TIGR02949 family)